LERAYNILDDQVYSFPKEVTNVNNEGIYWRNVTRKGLESLE